MVQMVVPNLMHMCVPKFLNYGATNTASPSYCLVWITVLLIENFESPLNFCYNTTSLQIYLKQVIYASWG